MAGSLGLSYRNSKGSDWIKMMMVSKSNTDILH